MGITGRKTIKVHHDVKHSSSWTAQSIDRHQVRNNTLFLIDSRQQSCALLPGFSVVSVWTNAGFPSTSIKNEHRSFKTSVKNLAQRKSRSEMNRFWALVSSPHRACNRGWNPEDANAPLDERKAIIKMWGAHRSAMKHEDYERRRDGWTMWMKKASMNSHHCRHHCSIALCTVPYRIATIIICWFHSRQDKATQSKPVDLSNRTDRNPIMANSSPALLLNNSNNTGHGLSDSESVSSMVVHPLVLLSILDHHTRRQNGEGRVIGTLLGRRDGEKVRANQ